MKAYQEMEDQFSLPLFNKRGLTLVRGENALVWDVEGRRYIDCAGGHGVVNVGHANPRVATALAEQAQTLITCTGSFYNDKRALLLKKLIEITPASLDKVFLCNSGAEAVEAALKFARLTTGKTDFVCARRGFHGRTMGALSATFNPNYKKDFEPLIPGFTFVPFNDFPALKKAITDQTAAVLLEVVQGEGGVHIGRKDYFEDVQKLCKERKILLIIDEVQTGFGRTGRMFASEYVDLQPDILCLAKGIAAGVPMGATLCSAKIKSSPGKHGSTFGGNPLACAAGLAAIEFIEEHNLPQQAFEKGQYFKKHFKDSELAVVKEVRQIGLMIGIELKKKAQPYIKALQEKGVIVIPAGPQVVRLLPPLTIEYELLDEVIEKLTDVLGQTTLQ